MTDIRPLVFVDLDDTLFQSARKMKDTDHKIPASHGVTGEPNGFMSNIQSAFVDWLMSHADVVPVTARSSLVYSRVRIPFSHGAVCSHGAVILNPDSSINDDWSSKIDSVLAHSCSTLDLLCQKVLDIGIEHGFDLRGWVVKDDGRDCYVVIKQNEHNDQVLSKLLEIVEANDLIKGIHIHLNGNNLAFIPNGINKKKAVQFWIDRDMAVYGERPILAFGDSLTDLGFMQQAHFMSIPTTSQIANRLMEKGYA